MGIDPATTTGETSNPTSVTVTQDRADGLWQPAVFLWKERNPKIARFRLGRILGVISQTAAGRVRRV